MIRPIEKQISDITNILIGQGKDIVALKEKLYELETEKFATTFNMSPEEIMNDDFVDGGDRGRVHFGARSKPLLESEILEAQERYSSAAQCARYLRVSFKTYQRYAKKYGIYKTGTRSDGKKREYDPELTPYPLSKILAGEIYHPRPDRLKSMIFKAGKKLKKCERCGWRESSMDDRYPLIIYFEDGDPTNQKLENIKIYCYNCVFVLRGYITKGPSRLPPPVEKSLPPSEIDDE